MKGFNNSIGWNLGRKKISNHLLDPLTSMPIKGTKVNKTKKIKKRMYDKINSLLLSKIEKKNIVVTPININTQCLKKKK